MPTLEIDGKSVEVENGRTIMDAANLLGITIPHFCYHRKLTIAANCRMCLVQVEKAPKPLPACATPVTEGMKVQTHSEYAVKAQKGVMEFLLINHPLDCPICDQGGECTLQDLAVGYGGSASRYQEPKRVVSNKNLGPLISTDMTRCIHCTRCVRFGQEIAGIQELGMAGRGEHSEILTFVGRTVDSEISGNVIDLCPVGALTSKPFRYSARAWELGRAPSISPHCGLGANITVQSKQGRVLRVLPRENESVNECWLSDKDRFAYEGLNADSRLSRPLVKRDGKWVETDWRAALELVADRLKDIGAKHGAGEIAALASPHQTLEELYLLQKLMRGMGSGNVDHRLRQGDFSLDAMAPDVPWLGGPVAGLSTLQSVLLIGSRIRADQPLLAHRLRQAAAKGAKVHVLGLADDDLILHPASRTIVTPSALPAAVGALAAAAREGGSGDDATRALLDQLRQPGAAVLLGNSARHHPAWGSLYLAARELAHLTGAMFGVLGEAANSVGGHVAGAVPMHGPLGEAGIRGESAGAMLARPRRAYVLLGAEPEFDCADPQQATAALAQAEFVVALSPYRHQATEYAHVILPIAPFSETGGTFINMAGTVQTFNGVVAPFGETRPGWKVLRVLGNLLGLAGFDHESVQEVRGDLGSDLQERVQAMLASRTNADVPPPPPAPADGQLQRVGEVPIYHADPIVRRAPSLQATRTGQSAGHAGFNARELLRLGIAAGDRVRIHQGAGSAVLEVALDDALPDGSVRVPAAHPLTTALGPMFGPIRVEKA